MSTTGLSDNIYVAFILSALVELPAYFACIVLMDHWGRKPTLCLVLFIAGVFCIPAGYASGTLQTVLVLLGIIIHLLDIIMDVYKIIIDKIINLIYTDCSLSFQENSDVRGHFVSFMSLLLKYTPLR